MLASISHRRPPVYAAAVALLVATAAAQGPTRTAVLRLHVADPTGAPRAVICELQGQADHVSRRAAGTDGVCVFRNLPAGRYNASVTSAGFRALEVVLKLPPGAITDRRLVLHVGAPAVSVTVTASPDPMEPGNARRLGPADLQRQTTAQPARQLVDLVRQQPGWLLEANGVLHPRGSEYETQYVVDGVPLLDNRSPAFAPPLDVSAAQSIQVRTGGYPAAYGRKLGGVVEVHSADEFPRGWHGAASLEAGSFRTRQLGFQLSFARSASSLQIDGTGAATDRFLDPPALENFSNRGHTGEIGLSAAHQFGHYRRLRLAVHRGHSFFDVPNELAQQLAGQREQHRLEDFSAQLWYQQVLSPAWLLDVHGSARDLTATLDSNAASTPILPLQDRGLHEFYGGASVTGRRGRHDLSAGADFIRTGLRENFQYTITDPSAFDPGVLPHFAFAQHAAGTQSSVYVQDHVAAGPLTVNTGLRWDYYGILLQQNAWSPRLAAAFNVRPLGIVLRASFDRVFNTPAMENLLLASSPLARQVTPVNLGLRVPPARANFYELGASRSFSAALQLEVRAFRRSFRNYADDDVFLNTGVSFPISFSSAEIEGLETTLHLRMRRFAADANFSNLSGVARFPVTGGLFLDGSADLLHSSALFRITQDQRSTASGHLQFAATKRLWLGLNGWYGSGLPVEADPGGPLTSDPRILSRVDFPRQRLRPSYAAGIAVGALVWKRSTRNAEMQFSLDNLTNHLNVIDFAGLFSGTALGAPRAANLGFKYSF